jgi:hypothetical protein
MSKKQFAKLAAKFGGWMEGDVARFPTVWAKQEFEKALAAA